MPLIELYHISLIDAKKRGLQFKSKDSVFYLHPLPTKSLPGSPHPQLNNKQLALTTERVEKWRGIRHKHRPSAVFIHIGLAQTDLWGTTGPRTGDHPLTDPLSVPTYVA